jgi:predicted DNA-binding transcriptional regulator AlpA
MTVTSSLLDLQALALLPGRSPRTIRRDPRRNPDAVPPRLQLPGTRLLRWREVDVHNWLAQFAPAVNSHGKGGAQ